MISVGVDVNQAKNDDGSTPLHIACHKGHIEVVATLLAENADVNRVAFGGITPLYAACHNGHIEVGGRGEAAWREKEGRWGARGWKAGRAGGGESGA